ncbi:EamA family transporter [Candidatus Roizmanbacteria bacterium]|nr:EamA family transporter [Candidatus Roizmanbacteria bacterium]
MRKYSLKQIGFAAFIFEAISYLLIALILVPILFPFKLNQIFSKPNGIIFSLFAGISLGLGVVSYFLAVKYGNSIILPSLIAPILASIVASVLAIMFLGESLSFVRIIGVILAFVGLFIFINYK